MIVVSVLFKESPEKGKKESSKFIRPRSVNLTDPMYTCLSSAMTAKDLKYPLISLVRFATAPLVTLLKTGSVSCKEHTRGKAQLQSWGSKLRPPLHD